MSIHIRVFLVIGNRVRFERGRFATAWAVLLLRDGISVPGVILKQEPSEAVIVCPYCGMSFREGCRAPVLETDRLCMVCGHTWKSRGRYIPRRCPSCRSVEWNVHTRVEVSCVKCGHRWIPRGGCNPAMCPRCKTHRWKASGKESEIAKEERLLRAVAMYSEGMGCLDVARETGVSLEELILRILAVHDGPVRMVSD